MIDRAKLALVVADICRKHGVGSNTRAAMTECADTVAGIVNSALADVGKLTERVIADNLDEQIGRDDAGNPGVTLAEQRAQLMRRALSPDSTEPEALAAQAELARLDASKPDVGDLRDGTGYMPREVAERLAENRATAAERTEQLGKVGSS